MLAAINRVCEPKSKNGIGSWYNKSMLPSLFTIPVSRATGQRFWDAMDRMVVKVIPAIEQDLWGKSLDRFSIPLDWLIHDTTNFFSYLAEQTPSQLNEKGHNKAFRHHLRQVGLAVSVVRGLGRIGAHVVMTPCTPDRELASEVGVFSVVPLGFDRDLTSSVVEPSGYFGDVAPGERSGA